MMDRKPSPLRPPFTPFRVDSSLQPIARDLHPVIHEGRVAVITGAASGIGKAAAFELAKCVWNNPLFSFRRLCSATFYPIATPNLTVVMLCCIDVANYAFTTTIQG